MIRGEIETVDKSIQNFRNLHHTEFAEEPEECNIYEVLEGEEELEVELTPNLDNSSTDSGTGTEPESTPNLSQEPSGSPQVSHHLESNIEKGRFDYPYEYDYELEFGGDEMKTKVRQMKKDLPPFYGYCYYCDYARHSQNYCPLKLCYACGDYGHSAKVCEYDEKRGENWRDNHHYPPRRTFKPWYKFQHFKKRRPYNNNYRPPVHPAPPPPPNPSTQ